MISETRVKELVEEKIKGTELFIVEVKVSGGNRISIALDRPTKLNVGDCAEVSRFVEAGLNRDLEDFEITVSSPGLEQPLRVLNQFLKHQGRNVRVVLKDGRLLRGKMTAANQEGITLEVFRENKKKNKEQTQNEPVNLKYPEIKETKIEITFK
ncbi:MAG: ribosome assembly cofactor RimP [Bacteroidia bacterium]